MGFTITSNQILWICGFIASLWGVYKIVVEIRKPSEDLKEKVESHEEKLNKDKQRLDDIEQSNKLILNSMLVIINHEITGNGIENMKKARDELQEYLINK